MNVEIVVKEYRKRSIGKIREDALTSQKRCAKYAERSYLYQNSIRKVVLRTDIDQNVKTVEISGGKSGDIERVKISRHHRLMQEMCG